MLIKLSTWETYVNDQQGPLNIINLKWINNILKDISWCNSHVITKIVTKSQYFDYIMILFNAIYLQNILLLYHIIFV